MKNTIVQILTAILALNLVGCSDIDISGAIERAEAEKDPAKALKIIRDTDISSCDNPMALMCRGVENLIDAERRYFIEAAKSGDEKVLRELFDNKEGEFLPLQKELKAKVLEKAKGSNDPNLLATAASIYGNSEIGIVSSEQQITYLSKAWVNGDIKSAGELSHLFAKLNDYEKAYLWSLRCINECSRSVGGFRVGGSIREIELDELQKHLTSDQIINIQKKAAEKD